MFVRLVEEQDRQWCFATAVDSFAEEVEDRQSH
jgi:hypothetical protein